MRPTRNGAKQVLHTPHARNNKRPITVISSAALAGAAVRIIQTRPERAIRVAPVHELSQARGIGRFAVCAAERATLLFDVEQPAHDELALLHGGLELIHIVRNEQTMLAVEQTRELGQMGDFLGQESS